MPSLNLKDSEHKSVFYFITLQCFMVLCALVIIFFFKYQAYENIKHRINTYTILFYHLG